ncbi:ABC transporter substrate-binding protein [Tessaracoccus lapidicaptus]|uniref:ABC transporter substrate-binding protein n=1 Tax=Tessaracoccus lapidicaptus TaxID=1427523 RepID=A0A1C0AKW0_9ACTN|nr:MULTISPECIES: ABC transporter substrate-binding protein [Tessaracoccus]AQX16020.1 ABC transporter substrate-binding protein [Tessaracoccus sp. T2.5-30]OCL33321.1 ABC transporter substrate-binding protein [Tessaracoccus lapidicaptus]VEP40530.1 hypothetical protein TLA_TLA_01795 [Tessaracoccus lapidicaptus]
MQFRKVAAFVVAPVIALSALAGCGPDQEGTQPSSSAAANGEFPSEWSEEITIDVFAGLANAMGEQPGWFAKIVKDKFNMKLNIIAPNVAGGGDTLYNTRVAAGDLGDLIVTDKGKKLDELVDGGLLLDVSEYYPAMSNAAKYDEAITRLNEGKDGTYAFPTQVSSLKATDPSEGIDPTFGPFVRWDYYAELGYPEVGTLEDLLPVLKQMQDAHPTAENGKKVYGLSLFKDWDGNMMNNAKQPTTFYGYDEVGMVLAKADGSDYQSIIDDDSQYVRSLKFFYEANQMGLLDPESTTQNYDTLFSKYQNGQVLFSWWPWQGQSAFNTTENMAAGEGFMLAPVEDLKVFSYGAEPFGGKQVLAVGSEAEDPERVAAFIDWLYSPEGTYSNNSQTMGAAGPKGLTWDLNDEGKPELTEFGMKALAGGGADVPAEWGGGTYQDGASWLNTTLVLPIDTDPETGAAFSYKMWETFQEATSNPLYEDWSAKMGDAPTTMDYLRDNDKLMVAPGASFTAPADSSEIETLRNQVKAIIVQESWKMSFASSEAEFDSLLAGMQETVKGLGYDKVLEVDMANAKAQNELREEAAARS